MARRKKNSRRRSKVFHINAIETGAALSLISQTDAAAAVQTALTGNITGAFNTINAAVATNKPAPADAKIQVAQDAEFGQAAGPRLERRHIIGQVGAANEGTNGRAADQVGFDPGRAQAAQNAYVGPTTAGPAAREILFLAVQGPQWAHRYGVHERNSQPARRTANPGHYQQ